MNKYVEMFGFDHWTDFYQSLLRINIAPMLIILGLFGSFMERVLGLSILPLTALMVLFVLELVTGVLKSKKKGIKIKSILLQRWGFKIFIWMGLIAILHMVAIQYCGCWEGWIFHVVYDFIIFYVIGVYIISICENMSEMGYVEFGNVSKFIKNITNLTKRKNGKDN